MVLEAVWDNLHDAVKRAFNSVAAESDRVSTEELLGAIRDVPGAESTGEIIEDLQSELGISLPSPAVVVETPGSSPESVSLSPAVKEALSFFNLHRIRAITPAKLIVRLLQLSGGNLTLALERNELLQSYINRFRNLQSEE